MKIILLVVIACLSASAQTPVISGGTPTISGNSGTPVIGSASGTTVSMPVVTGTGIGFYAVTGGNRPATTGGVLGISPTNNSVYCRAFYQMFTRTITTGVFYISTGASANADIGLYNMQGNLVADVGQTLVNTSSTVYSHAITQGSATIQGGQWYWQCQLCTSAAVTTSEYINGTGVTAPTNAQGTFMEMFWPSGVTTGILPATIGTQSAITTQGIMMTYWY